jgi:phosphate butyryltransferase
MRTIQEIIKAAEGFASGKIAVAAAHDADVLKAVAEAKRRKIAEPILVGHEDTITAILKDLGENPESYEIIHADSDTDCAAKAVECVSKGKANFLMKGLLNTPDIMRAVLKPEAGLRTGKLISHVMMYEPKWHRMMGLTDGGMNTFPDLEKKAEILENAAKVFKALGYDEINAACICGAEVVNPKIQSTVDAKTLSEMTDRWAKYNMNVYGPVGLDLAVSEAACHHKHYDVKGAGQADILLVPSYETGNGIGKAMSIFGGAMNAGIVVGAKVPIVLVSRADSAQVKLAAMALGAVVARGMDW